MERRRCGPQLQHDPGGQDKLDMVALDPPESLPKDDGSDLINDLIDSEKDAFSPHEERLYAVSLTCNYMTDNMWFARTTAQQSIHTLQKELILNLDDSSMFQEDSVRIYDL